MMNDSVFPSEARSRPAWAWGGVCLILLMALGFLWPQARLTGSVLALLPKQVMGSMPPALNEGFMSRLDRQLVWLVSPGFQQDADVARTWQTLLQGSTDLARVSGPMGVEQQQLWGAFYWSHRNGNIDRQTRERLQNGGEAQIQWVLAQMYSAFSGVSGRELRDDPLMLMRGAQLALAQESRQLQLSDGWLMTQDKSGRYWYLLYGELAGSSFDVQRTHKIVQELAGFEQILMQQFPDAQILSRGTLFYSDYASQQASKDISTLGPATVLGVILLILLVFRSLRPLGLCILSVGVGALAGVVSVLWIFGELHLMTLVMSMSIIGISVDYTLYFLTERMVHGREVTPWQSLNKVRATLLLALSTTIVAYLVMMVAPFPGIRQMAVFASAGLCASCLTVLFWHPLLCRGLPVRSVPAVTLMLHWLRAWRRQRWLRIGLPCGLAAISLIGLSMLKIDDDISQLQSLPQQMVQQEKIMTALMGHGTDQKWFVVYGPDPQATLQRLEAFLPALDVARQNGFLEGYRTIPISSLARQQQDLVLIRDVVPGMTAALAAVGVTDIEPDVEAMPVTVDAWLESPASEGWRLMWLTLESGDSGVLIPVRGGSEHSADLAALAEEYPGVAWIDRKASFDRLFEQYRTVLSSLLAVALGVVACGAIVRQGLPQGLRSLVPSVLSLAGALAILSFSGLALNLFSLLALVLVLGIGVNYTLFFSNPRGTPLTSMLAISLAMMTALLTLGMLIFSSTQAVSGFGIVLCGGIFIAFLLSPLAMPGRKERNK